MLINFKKHLASLEKLCSGEYNVRIYHEPSKVMDDVWEQIDLAEKEVAMITYIMKDDEVGRETLQRLTNAAKRGVKVTLLYDDAGNITGRTKLTSDLIANNGDVIVFRPFFTTFAQYIWSGFDFLESPVLRNHRKIFLIDNKIAYLGGLNIGNEYAGRQCTGPYLTSGKTFRDIMVKVTANGGGEEKFAQFREMIDETIAINDFYQRKACHDAAYRASKPSWEAFLETQEGTLPSMDESVFDMTLPPDSIVPPEEVKGVQLQLTACNPWGRDYSLQKSIFLSAKHARKRLWFVTPYYAPPEHLREEIEAAAERGVDVRVLVGGEGTTDPPIMRYAQHSWLCGAAARGVKVYEYTNTGEVMHAKMFVVDDDTCSVGSYNLDLLSDRILEANLLLHDKQNTSLLAQQFLYDSCVRGRYVSHADLKKRSESWSFRAAVGLSTGIYVSSKKLLGGNYSEAKHL